MNVNERERERKRDFMVSGEPENERFALTNTFLVETEQRSAINDAPISGDFELHFSDGCNIYLMRI